MPPGRLDLRGRESWRRAATACAQRFTRLRALVARRRRPRARAGARGARAFLAAVVAGGLASRLLAGGWRHEPGLGDEFDRPLGGGWRAFAALALGGVLVGMETSLCGGCSSGHGLSGRSRLQPGSLVATACFAAAAIATSPALG